MTRNRGGGRIRVTDDTAAIIGADVQVRAEHAMALNDTKSKESAPETRKGHRRRLRKLIEWWRDEYPDYFEAGTRVLSAEEKANPTKYYHTCDRDVVYEGLRVDMVLSYLAATKYKADGKLYSYEHIRKFHDAILFGKYIADQKLPGSYYIQMESFLLSYRKEHAEAGSDGNVDERSADPISFSLYRLILTWAIAGGNIFVWTWTILQWNLMARSISIDPLALHNIGISEDHFVICHDSTKSDKEGERTHNKAVYCNPLDPVLCPGVSLGIWLSLNQNRFRDSERIFVRRGTRIGSAAHRYCEQLHTMMKKYANIVTTYITTMSAHGIRKGSATHVACATTCPPPLASIAARGDWSLGKVLDIYWRFAEAGDNYLGRCLCGLDPNCTTFSVLPPHWTVENPVDDPDIGNALRLMYGVILVEHPSCIGVLLRVLASVVYASDWLLEMSGKHQGHPFSAIPLLQDPQLLLRLKAKVTIEPTVFMSKSTGVPPHVKQLNLITNLLELCHTTLLKVTDQATTVRQTIFDAMEERALENGQISRHQIITILDEFRNAIRADVHEQVETIRVQAGGMLAPPVNGGGGTAVVVHSNRGNFFTYGGRLWDVPASFTFPAGVKRDVGWKLWLLGMPGYATSGENGVIEQSTIKPFRKFVPARLPTKIADAYKIHWKPLFSMMEAGIGEIPPNLTPEIVNDLYDRGTENLQTRVSYIFANEKLHHNGWVVATWARYISRSVILKKGSDDDKRNLPSMKPSNRPRPIGLKRRSGEANGDGSYSSRSKAATTSPWSSYN